MRVRGLKPLAFSSVADLLCVAPHAGAWIETIMVVSLTVITALSHPMRVRGLKQLSTRKRP